MPNTARPAIAAHRCIHTSIIPQALTAKRSTDRRAAATEAAMQSAPFRRPRGAPNTDVNTYDPRGRASERALITATENVAQVCRYLGVNRTKTKTNTRLTTLPAATRPCSVRILPPGALAQTT